MPDVKRFFVGQPKPAREIEMTGRQRYAWLEILNAIQPGTAQQVTMKYDSVKNAIEKLEKKGAIKKGEYLVKGKGSANKRQVWVIRRGP